MVKSAKYISQARKIQKRVFFVGTADTSYDKGIGLCYNRDYGTATDRDGERDNYVEVPSRSNNKDFAGVLDKAVTLDSTGQQWVTINEPGSVCEIALGIDTSINAGRITCLAAGGDNTSVFWNTGFRGRGSAKPLETQTAVLESNLVGTAAISADGLTLTVVDSSDFVAGANGSKLIVLGGEDDGTGAVVPGEYTISSITNATTIVLSSTCMDATAAGAGTLHFVVVDSANATCLAYLEDGPESGLIDCIQSPNAGSTGLTYMVGGVTYLIGGIDIAADADVDLAVETLWFEKKGFFLMGEAATSDYTIDLVVNGIRQDGSTALTEVLTIDNDGDGWIGQWDGVWHTRGLFVGATEG